MPVNSLQPLMLEMSTDMITPVQKSSSRATPTVKFTVAASAFAKTTTEVHKQTRTYAVISKTSLEKNASKSQ